MSILDGWFDIVFAMVLAVTTITIVFVLLVLASRLLAMYACAQ